MKHFVLEAARNSTRRLFFSAVMSFPPQNKFREKVPLLSVCFLVSLSVCQLHIETISNFLQWFKIILTKMMKK